LKTLIIWALNTSEVITGIIRESYKQTRRDDDVNQPLSVQPWGLDGRKRRYFLIEGQTDTPFRVYRESAPKSILYTWWSVAGTIPELQAVETALRVDGSQAAKRLADRIIAAIPTLEATEEVFQHAFVFLVFKSLIPARSAKRRNIARHRDKSSYDQNQAFRYTKDVLVVRG